MKKRIILMLLAMLLSCTTLLVACADDNGGAEDSSSTPAEDSTPESDLGNNGGENNGGENNGGEGGGDQTADEGNILDLATMVSEGVYKLERDITVTETYMETFSGTFDGAGFTVTTSVPLFLNLEGAAIDSIVIAGEINSCPDDAMGWTGALACMANGASVIDSTNKAKIKDKTDTITHSSGFIGVTTGGEITFEGCTNEGEITGSSAAAGLIAQAKYEVGSEITITDCTNTGVIKCTNGPAGGIFGYTGEKEGVDVEGVSTTIMNCTNTAKVTSDKNKAGGIFGGLEGGQPDYYVSGCTNSGNITGNSYAGGIGGKVQNGREGLQRKIFTIEKCGNSGKIVAIKGQGDTCSDYDSPCIAGGVIGMFLGKNISRIKMTYCYSVGDVRADASSGRAASTYTLQNWAAGLCNVYQLRVAADISPNGAEPSTPSYDTSCFKLCYVSGKISVATLVQNPGAEATHAAMLATDMYIGDYSWTQYKRASMFQNNFIDTSECELPTVNAVSGVDEFALANYSTELIIAEGTLGTTFVDDINEKCGIDVYELGEGGFPVIIKE